MFFRCLKADLFKMKRNSVTVAHIGIPVIVSVAFLFYFAVSGRSHEEMDKVTGFYQTLGIAFPVLIGVFAASTMEQEQNAGAFQNLLTLKSKTAALFSKIAVLILFSLFSLLVASVIFGFGFCTLLGQGSTGIGLHIAAALVMWFSAIPLYLIFEILAFVFGKGVSIGAGLFSGLLSALFLTDIGMYAWKIVPFSWTARMPDAYLEARFGELAAVQEVVGGAVDNVLLESQFGLGMLNSQLLIYLLFMLISLLGYYAFAVNYEGSKMAE